jgi:hypothetical protein
VGLKIEQKNTYIAKPTDEKVVSSMKQSGVQSESAFLSIKNIQSGI